MSGTEGEGSARSDVLLARITDHILANGVANVSLRALARAADSNNRMLLYYFGSRAEIISLALRAAATRFPGMTQVGVELVDTSRPLAERLDRGWAELGSEETLPFTKLFFHVFGLAAFESGAEWHGIRARFDQFLMDELTITLEHEGLRGDDVAIVARQIVAFWRGLEALLVSLGPVIEVERVKVAGHAAVLAQVRALRSTAPTA
ncbi:TetR/AcrR family transcriptional regulator [Cryobacterium sp. AP23]